MKYLSILLIILFSFLIGQPQLYTPETISFQGLLTDSEGITYDDGEHSLIFRFIGDSDEILWEEEHITYVANGVFSVTLGSINLLPYISANDLLEIQVGEEILSPRQSFTSVPFALKSSNSQQALKAEFANESQHSTYSDTTQYSILAQNALNSNQATIAQNSIYSDTAMVASALIGGINLDYVEFASYADTAQYVEQAQSALTANQATTSIQAIYADTAQYVEQAQSALTAEQATSAIYATNADTAQFVALSQNSINSDFAVNSNQSVYADTSTYALNSFNSISNLSDLGIDVTSDELNHLSGITSNVQTQLDNKTGITQEQASAIEANTAKVGYTDALVSANIDVVANTAKVGITTSQSDAITANTAKVGYTDALVSANTDVIANTAKVGITVAQASAIEANSAKIGITSNQSNLLNEITSTSTELNLLDGVTASTSELNYIDGTTSNLQTQLNSKASSINELSDALSENNSVYLANVPANTDNAQHNIGVGNDALNSITTADYVSGVGSNALKNNTTGIGNSALGTNAMESNTTGEGNTVAGWNTLVTNTSGDYNVAMGVNTMFNNTTGSQNVALGTSALYSSTTSEGNVSVGNSSLYNNSTGNSNTALGSNALTNTTQGGNNVAIGYSAGRQNTTGSGNVFIGNEAGNTSSYQTASNKLVVANSDTETPLIEGDFSASTLNINGSVTATSFTGDGSGLTGITIQTPNQVTTKVYEVNIIEGENTINFEDLTGLADSEYLVTFVRLFPAGNAISGDHMYSEGDIGLDSYENGIISAGNIYTAPVFNFYDTFVFDANQNGLIKLWIAAEFP